MKGVAHDFCCFRLHGAVFEPDYKIRCWTTYRD